uniref:PIH1D1/2/3 CS-like domain-containing protein n=1 Tax=Chlamydomonas leiostraca TaxID=1034604 RepID=A0A7S0WQ44_9CHLO|mmetsp:Transcript_22323/g.56807  ORF Transcript_22323/g.56807 Transcript_22323/m.56807 type:complete len:183 (+) Transcript_22323:127-675(+)|eukprot:CAMPEP_0202878602 /NCGR_PEP_ID=MMETSP1391-20130828/32455_1 /ASSEMBLY_ACC=CAM_ASM_000867 /TAXON_ID=1034604 /ORGANISM="Chlamydomonas leiostraca, Strain SAG 11-49" /LENGTH=182 /DNA_ID=CAMNT_0049560819 /DNA_START=90 /DNA_END=638 /DNA_ORIENTATION=-
MADTYDFNSEFNALSKLLVPEEEAVDAGAVSKPTPASIGPKDLLNVKVPAPRARKDPKEIWDESEIQDVVEDDIDDGREVPEYEFMYKQAVESTDVFLGMSGKDESSTSCEQMVVKVQLPGVESISELDLDVKRTYLKLNSTQYKLSIYLPHKVDEDKGKAKWDKDKRVLSVTLPIIREDEF